MPQRLILKILKVARTIRQISEPELDKGKKEAKRLSGEPLGRVFDESDSRRRWVRLEIRTRFADQNPQQQRSGSKQLSLRMLPFV